MKFALKVPYRDGVSVEARAVLVAIADSARTFGGGRPCESFAHRHGCFQYSSVMTVHEHPDRERETSPPRDGGGDPSDHHTTRHSGHTEKFTLWLNNAVERAERSRENTLSTPTTTT